MNAALLRRLLAASLFLLAAGLSALADEPINGGSDVLDSGVAVMIDIQGAIGPATADFIIDSLDEAAERNAALMIIRLDTPGGLDTSTRDIVKAILNSPLPVATYVAPEGARAASAGTYIMYASHIAAMSPATNIGAATPVAIIGGDKPAENESARDDQDAEGDDGADAKPAAAASGDAMSRKTINDAVAYARGLAAKHGRNAEWAELAVREAASVPANEALELGVIDLVARNVGDLLDQANGRTVLVLGEEQIIDSESLVIERLEPDWKSEFLSVITSPTIAYILLLMGIYGLILEGYHPGAIVPGVVGAISLLIALYAFQMLPINYAGVGLIVLGVILMIAEVMVPSFGALGIGGVIAMVIGSIILIDTDAPGFAVSRPLIGAIGLAGALGVFAIITVAMKARKRPVVAGREEMIGAVGVVLEDFEGHGYIDIHGERWGAESDSKLRAGQAVRVRAINGLTLVVAPTDA